MILILDTVLPIVNRATTDGVIEKVPEGHGSYYVILEWSGVCVMVVTGVSL